MPRAKLIQQNQLQWQELVYIIIIMTCVRDLQGQLVLFKGDLGSLRRCGINLLVVQEQQQHTPKYVAQMCENFSRRE